MKKKICLLYIPWAFQNLMLGVFVLLFQTELSCWNKLSEKVKNAYIKVLIGSQWFLSY